MPKPKSQMLLPMATSITSSIANLFSLFNPSKQPPPRPQILPPPHLSAAAVAGNAYPGRTPLVLSNEPHTSPSSSADVMQAVCPSLAYANTMFFRSAYNVQVIVDDNEHEERLIGRFRREVMRAGVIQECKRRRYFENKQEEKKRRTRDAAKRNRRRRPMARPGPQDRQEASKDKKEDKDEDNWDLPEGDLPY